MDARTEPAEGTAEHTPTREDRPKSRHESILWNLALIAAGSLLCAWAINGVLVPHRFLSGGVTGLALIIHHLFPFLSIGLLYLVINIPIYVLGWLYIGRRFFWYSLAGLAIFSGAILVIHPANPIEERLLAALLAGIVYGAGGGIILRSLGSAGGTDILSIILLQRYSIRIGSTVLFFNAGILILSTFLFDLESVIYTLIFMFVSSRLVDLVVTGFSQRKAVLIISAHWEAISEMIVKKMNRSVTLVPAEGGYRHEQGKILYTVVTISDLPQLKNYIRQIDPNPFVVVTNTLEVIGQRIGNQPHW